MQYSRAPQSESESLPWRMSSLYARQYSSSSCPSLSSCKSTSPVARPTGMYIRLSATQLPSDHTAPSNSVALPTPMLPTDHLVLDEPCVTRVGTQGSEVYQLYSDSVRTHRPSLSTRTPLLTWRPFVRIQPLLAPARHTSSGGRRAYQTRQRPPSIQRRPRFAIQQWY